MLGHFCGWGIREEYTEMCENSEDARVDQTSEVFTPLHLRLVRRPRSSNNPLWSRCIIKKTTTTTIFHESSHSQKRSRRESIFALLQGLFIPLLTLLWRAFRCCCCCCCCCCYRRLLAICWRTLYHESHLLSSRWQSHGNGLAAAGVSTFYLTVCIGDGEREREENACSSCRCVLVSRGLRPVQMQNLTRFASSGRHRQRGGKVNIVHFAYATPHRNDTKPVWKIENRRSSHFKKTCHFVFWTC